MTAGISWEGADRKRWKQRQNLESLPLPKRSDGWRQSSIPCMGQLTVVRVVGGWATEQDMAREFVASSSGWLISHQIALTLNKSFILSWPWESLLSKEKRWFIWPKSFLRCLAFCQFSWNMHTELGYGNIYHDKGALYCWNQVTWVAPEHTLGFM